LQPYTKLPEKQLGLSLKTGDMRKAIKLFLLFFIFLKFFKIVKAKKYANAAICFFENLYEKIKFAVITFQKELESYEHGK